MNRVVLVTIIFLLLISCGVFCFIKLAPFFATAQSQASFEQSVAVPTSSVYEDTTIITMTVGSFAQIQDNLISRITEHDQEMAKMIVEVSHAGDASQTIMSSTSSMSIVVFAGFILASIAVLAFLIMGKK